ncbi:MAG: RNA polymerase sigma factor [Candidatus Limnocylindria bacterium]
MTTTSRRDQVGEYFAANADRHRRTVARHARVSDDVLDDACANAWTALLRRPDITLDARGFSWLKTVAIREAWRLHRSSAHETPLGSFQGDSRGHDNVDVPEPADVLALDTESQALDHIQHAVDIEAFKTLKPRERQALYLKGLGYSYDEICRLTGFSYTAVNRYITEGRRALRRGGYTPQERARHPDIAGAGGENVPSSP